MESWHTHTLSLSLSLIIYIIISSLHGRENQRMRGETDKLGKLITHYNCVAHTPRLT